MATVGVYSNDERMKKTEVARQHIEEIRSRKFSIGQKSLNPLTQDLHNAVTSLSKELYTKDVHFLMELIQNAEDNEYLVGVEPTLEVVLTRSDITGLGCWCSTTRLVFLRRTLTPFAALVDPLRRVRDTKASSGKKVYLKF